MKISLNWIKDYVSPGVSVETLVKRLTMAGIEAEKIEQVGGDSSDFSRAKGDTVIEFEVTPNRPDCLSMLGIAREIAAVLDKPLTLPEIKAKARPAKKCDVIIEAPEACARYIGTVIEGVKVKQTVSPKLLRLTRLGQRAINNVVDVTNFCLLETGHPLHAFDLDKLKGGRAVVRFARAGEKLVTLDGVERELDPSVLVIADAERPVALAGIMGGMNSEVDASTKNVFLESAHFHSVLIRRTARKFGLSTDASYRFERGVFFDNIEFSADRAVDLIVQTAGGRVTARRDVTGAKIARPKSVVLNLAKMQGFLGATVSMARTKQILKALGFSCIAVKKGSLKVTPPVCRPDIRIAEDLYEEVARVIGYDQMPSSFPTVKVSRMPLNVQRQKRWMIADCLLSQGFNEVVTYALLSMDQIVNAGVDGLERVMVLNPLSRDQEVMRPHFLPSLLQVAAVNINHGQKDLAFFEIGKVYLPAGEKETVGCVLTGCLRADWRHAMHQPFDFYDVKGAVERMLAQMKADDVSFARSSETFLEEGQRADIFIGSQRVGCCGKVAGHVAQACGIKQQDVFFAQIDIGLLPAVDVLEKRYIPLCGFPSITRDISIAVDRSVAFDDVRRVIQVSGAGYLKRLEFKEEYLGEKIPSGQRGLVFSLVYQSEERTLTEGEIQTVHDTVCRNLQNKLGAVMR